MFHVKLSFALIAIALCTVVTQVVQAESVRERVCKDAYGGGVYSSCCNGHCTMVGRGDPNTIGAGARFTGDIYSDTINNRDYRWSGSTWTQIAYDRIPSPTPTTTP